MSKKQYEQRKKDEICVRCGKKPSEENRVMCKDCLEKMRKRNVDNRAFYKKHGLCPRCGKRKLFGKEKTCPECLAEAEIARKRWVQNKGGASEWYKKDIARLKENGLCRSCRGRKVVIGKTYCEICLIKKREKGRIYRMEKAKCGISRSERPSYNLCYTCGAALDRDGRVCTKCAEKMAKNLPKTGGNAVWRRDNELIFKN